MWFSRMALRQGAALSLLALGTVGVQAQVLDEDFTGVAGNGSTFFSGSGFGQTNDWDAFLNGENAFAGTAGYGHIGDALARGLATGGVGGSGGGLIQISGVSYNLIDENFNAVTGAGGGAFLVGNGLPDTNGFTPGWDTGINGEQAFGGTFGGAILVGNMTASGITSGGIGNTGRGQLRVNNVTNGGGNWYAGVQWPLGALPGATVTQNASFENGLNGWTEYSEGWNIDAVAATGGPPAIIPRTGNALCKMFGRFWGTYNASGVFQELPAQAGQTWEIHGYARSNSDDSVAGTQNFMQMRIEFVDAGGAVLLSDQATIFTGSSPLDTWVDPAPLQLTAPAGTVGVRPVFEFVQPGEGLYEGGAIHLDDISARLVGGPGGIDLSTFSLQASVRGTASAGAGETLGGIQLRIEDANGNRLLFNTTANGSYQTLGGPLSTATEADASGNPASGVFDRNSSNYVVVLAFNTATSWGTGGTLDIDDLRFSNLDSSGSAWYGGLYWNALSIPQGTGLDELAMTADIKGDTVGGAYQLRLEGYRNGAAGLDENFDSVTGVGGGTFLSDADVAGGTTFGSDSDWDTGISGEGAYGGVFGQAEVFAGGGFSAQGLVGGGVSGGAGEVSVLDIIVGPGGGWYAGLSWGNQGLASADLSQVTLSANIRGIAQPGGNLGVYELRIEDAQGDRMYWQATATGEWQTIGGPLSMATEGPRLGGGGDGVFDLNSSTYTIALSFIEPETTWLYGGTLQIDDLFLTPVATRTEVGRVTFRGTSDGSFQSVGGLLNDGETSFGNYSQDFSGVTGVGGGIGGAWDTGIENEGSFYGTYGNASGGTALAQGCLTCGVDGGKGAEVSVHGVSADAGSGFYVGVTFTNVHANLRGDLSQKFLTAQIRGIADANQGEILGTYLFRVEDADITSLQWEVPANGNWQDVGGALSTATQVQINQGDNIFNFNQDTYTITVAFVSTATNWNTGGTLNIDNLFISGTSLDDANEFVVAIAFDDEVASWGNAGAITVDNVYLGPPTANCPGDLNGDNQVNLGDLAQLLSNFGTPSGATFEQGDLTGDGAVSLNDLALLLSVFGSICP